LIERGQNLVVRNHAAADDCDLRLIRHGCLCHRAVRDQSLGKGLFERVDALDHCRLGDD
jgi:hypothetical protein